MAYEQKDNSGSIWVNDRKEKDTHPDRTGTVKVGGKDYYISGWLKEANGKKFMSLSFKPKEPVMVQGPKSAGGPSAALPYDDSDIPW